MKYRVIRADGTVAYEAKELSETERALLADLGCRLVPVPPFKITLFGGPLHGETRYINMLTTYYEVMVQGGLVRYEQRGEGSHSYVAVEVPREGTAIESAKRAMLAQREKGMKKYGVPIEDSGLSPLDLILGAQEEVADAAVYLAEGLRRWQDQSDALFEDLRNLGVLAEWDRVNRRWKVQYDPQCVVGTVPFLDAYGTEYRTVMLRVPV